MNSGKNLTASLLSLALMCSVTAISSCSGKTSATDNAAADTIQQKTDRKRGKPGGPQLGTPGVGPVIDKSGDAVLQSMIKTEVPEFRQLEYTDAETGKTLHYNLYTPKDMKESARYPMVLFMADASTPGTDVTRPLT